MITDYRNGGITSADTFVALNRQVSGDEENPVVPPEANRITGLDLSVSFDTLDTEGPIASVFRLSGPGLATENDPFDFVGPCGSLYIDTEGAVFVESPMHHIPINVPVNPDQRIVLEAKMLDTDLGTMDAAINVHYDGPTSTPRLIGAEVREGDITTADTPVDLDTDIDDSATTRTFEPSSSVSRLEAVDVAVGFLPTGAADQQIMHEFQIDGNALQNQRRPQKWTAWNGALDYTTNGVASWLRPPHRQLLQLPITESRADTLIGRAAIQDNDYGSGVALMGALYA